MIISIEQELVSCVIETGIEITFQHSVHRADFFGEFAGVNLSETRQLSYEPDRGLYHIIEADHSLLVLSDPSEDPRMSYIHENKDAISAWMREQYDEQQIVVEELANSGA